MGMKPDGKKGGRTERLKKRGGNRTQRSYSSKCPKLKTIRGFYIDYSTSNRSVRRRDTTIIALYFTQSKLRAQGIIHILCALSSFLGYFVFKNGMGFDLQTYPFRIENPYIWKKLSVFSCIFIFPPYLCSDSTTDGVPHLGNLYIYCKHFTKIIPN